MVGRLGGGVKVLVDWEGGILEDLGKRIDDGGNEKPGHEGDLEEVLHVAVEDVQR